MKYYFPVLLGVFLLCNCSNKYSMADKNVNDEVLESSNSISYRLGKNFFIKNDYNASQLKKSFIDNPIQFNHVFSVIHSKFKDSDTIDFDNELIIPIILDKTTIGTKISINDIHVVDNEVLVDYTVNQLHELSYIIQPFEIIIIDKSIVKDLSKLKLKFNKTTNLL